MTVLLTRPLADSQRIAAELKAHGVVSLIWPLTRIEMVARSFEVLKHVEALAFTSSHAVRAFCEHNTERRAKVFFVGNRTARIARDAGFTDVESADGNFEALVALIRNAHPRSVLYLRGERVSADLEAALTSIGIDCESHIVYTARPGDPPEAAVEAAFCSGEFRAVTIWSRHNADLLRESILMRKDWNLLDTCLVGISDNAVTPLGNLGFRRIIVASRPNATQMVAEIRAAVR